MRQVDAATTGSHRLSGCRGRPRGGNRSGGTGTRVSPRSGWVRGRRYVYMPAAGLLVVMVAMVALVLLHLPAQDPVVATTLLGLFPDSMAVDDQTGRAFVANSLDTTVDVLDINSGKVLLSRTVGSNGGAHPEAVVVDARDNRVFVATDDGLISMLDASSGALLRARSVGGSVQTMAVDERRRRLFVADVDSGSVTMLDARSGVILHRSAAGTFPQELGVEERTDRVFVADSADDAVTMLDAATGTVVRVVHVGFVPRGMAVSVPLGRMFVAPAGGSSVRVLDARSGAPLRMIVLGHRSRARFSPQASLAIDERTGHLFVATGTWMHMLDARTGQLLHSAFTTSPVVDMAIGSGSSHCLPITQGASDGRGHLRSAGAVLVLDTRTGMVERSVAVGAGPHSIVLDERRKRALVVNTNVNTDGSVLHL